MRRESGVTLSAGRIAPATIELIESSGVVMSATELLPLIQTNRIPLYDPPRMDERRFCRHAIDGAAASEVLACPCLQSDLKGLWCSLNGSELRSPCVFLEPQDAPVWREIREYAERWGVR